MIPDSTNVRVMADNIRKLSGSVDSIEAMVPKIPKDYSETEQATGLKWIDGKDVYCKVISGLVDAETDNIYNLSFDEIVNIFGTLTAPNGTKYNINRVISVYGNPTKTAIVVFHSAQYPAAVVNAIVYYTKPAAPSKSPDEEPETKKATKRKTTKGEN